MIGQTLPALKGLRTESANKSLFQCTAPVPLERMLPCEVTFAQRAHVGARFLCGVITYVPVKSRLVSKLRPTICASVKLLSCVFS